MMAWLLKGVCDGIAEVSRRMALSSEHKISCATVDSAATKNRVLLMRRSNLTIALCHDPGCAWVLNFSQVGELIIGKRSNSGKMFFRLARSSGPSAGRSWNEITLTRI